MFYKYNLKFRLNCHIKWILIFKCFFISLDRKFDTEIREIAEILDFKLTFGNRFENTIYANNYFPLKVSIKNTPKTKNDFLLKKNNNDR